MLVDYNSESRIFFVVTDSYETVNVPYLLLDRDKKGDVFNENPDSYGYKIFYKRNYKENDIFQVIESEENGSINIAEDVVAAIAADAIGEIEGVGSMCQNMTEQITEQFTGKKGLRGVRAEVKDGEIIVDVYLMVRYGYVIPETARKVQDSVSAAVSGMTGYNVHAVNVHVGGISFN